MKIALSDIADRWSICRLKIERASIDCQNEFDALTNELSTHPELAHFMHRLYEINGEIWDLESDIRKGKEGILGLEEVGRRAILIRDKNKIRIAIKNEICEIAKDGFFEIKGNHGSS